LADALSLLATLVGTRLAARGVMLATAESCTGGGVAQAVTEVAGSSGWFERGFVTYSNAAKTELLGVATELIAAHGAVSGPVAEAMARGAISQSKAQVSLAITGVAGPAGGSEDKPVGTVWFAWGVRLADGELRVQTEKKHFPGDRAQVRRAAVLHSLNGVLARLET
jgi:nicotinamide-nucleotide amidase